MGPYLQMFLVGIWNIACQEYCLSETTLADSKPWKVIKKHQAERDTPKTPVRNTYWVVVSDVFYFHPYFGEMIQFEEYCIFNWVAQPPTS